jgi:hypothetical protein
MPAGLDFSQPIGYVKQLFETEADAFILGNVDSIAFTDLRTTTLSSYVDDVRYVRLDFSMLYTLPINAYDGDANVATLNAFYGKLLEVGEAEMLYPWDRVALSEETVTQVMLNQQMSLYYVSVPLSMYGWFDANNVPLPGSGMSYDALIDKPSINGVTLEGDKTLAELRHTAIPASEILAASQAAEGGENAGD